jgi:hypothetical protein
MATIQPVAVVLLENGYSAYPEQAAIACPGQKAQLGPNSGSAEANENCRQTGASEERAPCL